MGAEVSKVSRICGKKKGPKTPGSADPNTNDPVDEEFMEDFDDGGLIEKNRDNYFHKEDVERIAKKFENYKEWMDQSLSSSRKPSIRQKKMKWKEGEIIGTGSYGRVILGLNLQTGSIMAVKQVQVGNSNTQSQQERIKALEIEIDLLSQLSHKNIVRYYGSHQSKTTFNIFLEYISGGTIASLIDKYGPLNENLARVYTRQILEGLEYLHVRNTIHRDIKGANVLVDNSGICKLADFGTAKRISSIVESELRYMPSIRGTVNWMAPEVIKQTSLGRQSDIWSVGCTLLEMVTGKIPWAHLMRPGATQVSALYQIASAKTHPPLPEGLSPETVDFLKQCFKINPQDRPNVVKLLNHKFIAGESPERPLETPDKQRSITSRNHLPPSSARHKKAESISSRLGDKLEGSKHISAFSRQRFDTHRDHLGGTEESEPIMISSPGGREERKTARDPDRKLQMSARDTKKEVNRLRSSKYTFNTEEQEKIKSPSLAPVKSNNGILPSLPDDNPSNVYLVSRPDSFLEDNLLKRERIMSDPEYVNLITDNANNDSHHIVRTQGQTARDTQFTDPNSPQNNGRLRTRDFEQKRNLEPLNLNKKLRTRPLGKNETAKRDSLGGKDDESSNILLSLGDIVKNQAGGQDTSGLHLRSKSNFGLTSRALQPSNTAIEEQKPDSPVVEEKKNEAHKRLGTLGLETPRYLETEPRQPTKGGSRVLEARESDPTPRLAFNNKTLMNSKTTGHSNGGLDMAIHRQAAATHRGIVTHRDANDTSSDRSTLARMRFGKYPPEKKISIKVKEVLMDNDTELNMESYDRDNTAAEPNFTGIPVAGSVILDKVMEKDGHKDGQETKRVKAA